MTTVEHTQYIAERLRSRGIHRYYLDHYTLLVPPTATRYCGPAHRARYFLLTRPLPDGVLLYSETLALLGGQDLPTEVLPEFFGQLALDLPAPGALTRLDFIRILSHE